MCRCAELRVSRIVFVLGMADEGISHVSGLSGGPAGIADPWCARNRGYVGNRGMDLTTRLRKPAGIIRDHPTTAANFAETRR